MSKPKAVTTERALVLPDIHNPVEDKLSMRAVERYMADHKWAEVIYLGDFVDLGVISSHNKHNLRAISGKSLAQDYAAANDMLDRHQRLCPGAKFTLIQGNHEHRAERLVDAQPVLQGSVEPEICLSLGPRGIEWVPFWSDGAVYSKGKANFGHGWYTGKGHSRKTIEACGANFFYGHDHGIECTPKVFRGDNDTVVAQSLGCLLEYRQSYIQGRPTNWQQGMGVFHFRPDGFFNYSVVMIFDHAFVSPEGVFYDGKKR